MLPHLKFLSSENIPEWMNKWMNYICHKISPLRPVTSLPSIPSGPSRNRPTSWNSWRQLSLNWTSVRNRVETRWTLNFPSEQNDDDNQHSPGNELERPLCWFAVFRPSKGRTSSTSTVNSATRKPTYWRHVAYVRCFRVRYSSCGRAKQMPSAVRNCVQLHRIADDWWS